MLIKHRKQDEGKSNLSQLRVAVVYTRRVTKNKTTK